MTVTLTNRLLMSKPDVNELVSIALINNNMDLADANFIPAAKMHASVAQTFTTGVQTAVAYNVTDYDSYAARSEGAMVNLGTDLITIRKAGLYLVKAQIVMTANATGTRRFDIQKNGANQIAMHMQGLAGVFANEIVVGQLVCAVNDTIGATQNQNSGGNLASISGSFPDETTLEVTWLGSIS